MKLTFGLPWSLNCFVNTLIYFYYEHESCFNFCMKHEMVIYETCNRIQMDIWYLPYIVLSATPQLLASHDNTLYLYIKLKLRDKKTSNFFCFGAIFGANFLLFFAGVFAVLYWYHSNFLVIKIESNSGVESNVGRYCKILHQAK